MLTRAFSICLFTLICCFSLQGSEASSEPSNASPKQHSSTRAKYRPYLALEQHLELAQKYSDLLQWHGAFEHYQMLLSSDDKAIASTALYGCALCEYHLGDLEEANERLNSYLKEHERDQRYNDIIQMKFAIADQFRYGAKRRLFGWSMMPKCLNAKDEAIELYEEIALALPRAEIGAKALIAKAQMLRRKKAFGQSNTDLQQVVSDFDRHPLVLVAFEEITRNYLVEMRSKSRNEELLELARINRQKMAQRFPNATFIKTDKDIHQMRELYADSLLEAAELYHKKHQEPASLLYLGRVSQLYQDTESGQKALQLAQKGGF